MPASIDDGRGAAVTLGLVYEQSGVSLAVAGGGSVSITPIKPLPVDPIYRIAFTPSATLTAIGAATQTRAVALGAAAATQFMAAVVQARSAQIQAAAEVAAVGGKTDSRLIQFTPSARLDPFIEGAQIEARDIRLTPSADLAAVGAQVEARAVQTSSTAELQPVGGRVVLRSAAIAASVTTSFVGEAVSAAGFLLDDYPGADFAYSLRQLSSTTTHVARVQRSSDNAEDDFTASEITDGTLTAWVGAGNDGLVVTRYDQSGNGRDATQSNIASQMKVVASGALVTENGKPVMLHDGIDDGYAFTPSGATIEDILIVCTQTVTDLAARRILSMRKSALDDFQGNGLIVGRSLFGIGDVTGGGSSRIDTSDPPLNELYIRSHQKNSTAFDVRENGVVLASKTPPATTTAPDDAAIGYAAQSGLGAASWIGAMGDLICYTSDQSANVTAIEQEVAGYYGITL